MNNHSSKNAVPLWNKNLIMVLTVNLLLYLGFQMLLPVMSVYANHLGAADSVVGWVSGIFVASAFLVRPIVGYMLDKTGRFIMLVIGTIIIILSVFSYSLVSGVAILIVLRLVHGVGWGAFHTSTATITADSVPQERMGEGMSYFGFTSSIAMALSPMIALYILNAKGFAWVFGISAAFAVVSFFMSFFLKCKKIDAATAAKARIVIAERTALRPAVVVFFITTTFGAVMSFLPLYAIEARLEDSGMFFAVYATTLLVSRPITGKLVDRIGVSYCVIPGAILVAMAMTLLSVSVGPAMFIAVAILYGLGFGSCHASLQAMSVMNTPQSRFGAANATFLTMFDCGMAIGSVVAGSLSAVFGYGRMFLCMAGCAIISLVLFLLTARKKVVPAAADTASPEADTLPTPADIHETE